MLIADFKRLPKKVKAVKQLLESAKVHGVELVRKPATLEPCWIAWHKSHVD